MADDLKNVDGVHMHLENKSVSKKFFWTLWIMYAVVYMTKNCYSAAMASIVHEGVLTKSQTGFITAAFYFVYAPLQILGGIYADKYKPEKMIKIGLIGGGIANLIIFCNQNYYVMLFAWIFNAVIQFALWPAIFKIISSQLESEYRVKGVYFITFSSTFGLVLAYMVAAVVTNWLYNFILSAIFLFLFAFVFHIINKRVERYMVPDNNVKKKDKQEKEESNGPKISSWRLFWCSGFILMIVITALRSIIANSVQTLSSTMLVESYANVSPALGNILNTLIIISGIIGVMLVNWFVYPRLIRNEVLATLALIGFSIVPVGAMLFLGSSSVAMMVVSMCVTTAILTGAGLIMSHFSAMFGKYGKNGLASGVYNSAVAIAIVIQNYGVLTVAEYGGWNTVVWLWIAMLIICVILAFIAFPLRKRFR